jgi:hypothetical protein
MKSRLWPVGASLACLVTAAGAASASSCALPALAIATVPLAWGFVQFPLSPPATPRGLLGVRGSSRAGRMRAWARGVVGRPGEDVEDVNRMLTEVEAMQARAFQEVSPGIRQNRDG